MRTVGQTLKEEREKKFYTLEEVEKATKIRKELLIALESGDYSKLPPATFIQGFIKNYGRFLGLDVETLLAIFRREFSDRKNPPKILDSWKNPLNTNKFYITPTKVISGVIIGLIVIFFGYLWFEYRFLVGAPYLEIHEPQDNVSIESSVVKVVGKTDSEASVTINNQLVRVDIAGNFSEEIKLNEPANTLIIAATSKSGKTATIERTVFLKR